MEKIRFFDFTGYLQVGLAAVFIGESAKSAWSADWPEELMHHAVSPRVTKSGQKLDATMKLYPMASPVRGDGPGRRVLEFDLSVLNRVCAELNIQEAFFEWALYRSKPDSYKMACVRASEGILWGFGRPHPFKPKFKPHKSFAGPLVDCRPGQKEGWNFEPVFLKAASSFSGGDMEETWKFYPRWSESSVGFIGELAPPDLPDVLKNWHPLRRREVAAG